jgi:hypothetical protein
MYQVRERLKMLASFIVHHSSHSCGTLEERDRCGDAKVTERGASEERERVHIKKGLSMVACPYSPSCLGG